MLIRIGEKQLRTGSRFISRTPLPILSSASSRPRLVRAPKSRALIAHRRLKLAFMIYRRSHSLLSADEIRAIRDRFNLTQADLARLLRFGANTSVPVGVACSHEGRKAKGRISAVLSPGPPPASSRSAWQSAAAADCTSPRMPHSCGGPTAYQGRGIPGDARFIGSWRSNDLRTIPSRSRPRAPNGLNPA